MRSGSRWRLAAFHLEKLLTEGFLEATYEHDEGSVGVGHPAKRYRPTVLELEVYDPPRRYDLAAEILAEALEADAPDPALESLADKAAEYGRQIGRQARARNGGSRLLSALDVIGYEPATEGGDVVLRNCPFRRVAQARPDVICPDEPGIRRRCPGRHTVTVPPTRFCRLRRSGAASSSLHSVERRVPPAPRRLRSTVAADTTPPGPALTSGESNAYSVRWGGRTGQQRRTAAGRDKRKDRAELPRVHAWIARLRRSPLQEPDMKMTALPRCRG